MVEDLASGGHVVQTKMVDDLISAYIIAPNLTLTSDM